MDRRDFVKIGAFTGASGLSVLGSSSCATLQSGWKLGSDEPELPDMDTYLVTIDGGLDTISEWSPASYVPSYTGDAAAADALGQKSLRTLYMTGMFGDLPLEGQLHPGMQERMWAAMPEMEEAATLVTEFLSGRSNDELKTLQEVLRHPDNPGMTIVEELTKNAGRCGVSNSRRMQTRLTMTNIIWRLRNQPPSLLIDEYLDKVEKVSATDVSLEAQQRWTMARMSKRVFWETQRQVEEIMGGWEKARPMGTTLTMREYEDLRKRRMTRGGRTMGIGVLIFAFGGIVVAAGAFPGVFAMTVGAIMFFIGLLTLLVGLGTSPGEHIPGSIPPILLP